MKSLSTFTLILSDLHRYTNRKFNFFLFLTTFFNTPGFAYTVLFRLAKRIEDIKIIIIKYCCKLFINWTLLKLYSIIFGIKIELETSLGPGFYIGHYGCIIIGPKTVGKNCNISHGVTIGRGTGHHKGMVPRLGNNVYIAPGAKLFGNIKIGNNVSIGANAVVSKNIPDNCVVVGNPGRIVLKQTINQNIQYPIK